jgi:hypothetical protein
MDNKKLLVGGLAVVGAIALFMYLKPKAPRINSDGFFGANGRGSRTLSLSSAGGCTVCDGGSTNYWAQNGRCRQGDNCVR